jgi:uncharacterized protein (DUF849 family)
MGFGMTNETQQPCIITVAITGSVPRKEHNPSVPTTVEEQVEATAAAYAAGASIVHVHVRTEDQTPTSDPSRFAEFKAAMLARCPDIILQFSTGGRSGSGSERGGMLYLHPEMASLATGSCNFPTRIYENPPELIEELALAMRRYAIKPEIEVFDLAMLYSAIDYVKAGLIKGPLHVQFVLGVRNALPARREILEFAVSELKTLMPDATWVAAGIGRFQLEVNRWCLEMGGHCRTGLEDNIRWDKERLAASNAELVERVARLSREYGRSVASPAEARQILGLGPERDD